MGYKADWFVITSIYFFFSIPWKTLSVLNTLSWRKTTVKQNKPQKVRASRILHTFRFSVYFSFGFSFYLFFFFFTFVVVVYVDDGTVVVIVVFARLSSNQLVSFFHKYISLSKLNFNNIFLSVFHIWNEYFFFLGVPLYVLL